METLIIVVVWFYSTLSAILWVRCIYLFTIREWLDWRIVRLGKPDYDFNGKSRMNKMRKLYE